MRKSTFLQLAGLLALLPCIVLLPPAAPATGIFWDWANLLGYLAAGVFLLMFLYPAIPTPFPLFTNSFYGNFHRDMGYVLLILAGLHITVLMVKEPLLIEHLKPTAPGYMLSGLAAAILMTVLVLTSPTKNRSKLWPNRHIFRASHLVLSLLAGIFLYGHILGSRFYLNTHWKIFLFFSFTTAVVVHYSANFQFKTICPYKNGFRNATPTWLSPFCIISLSMAGLLIVMVNHL